MKITRIMPWAAMFCAAFVTVAARAAEPASAKAASAQEKKPNIVFIITDQRAYRLFAGADYTLPGMDTIAKHGVTFRNHYIASAMCSPSRAAFLSGQPPQVNHVIDQMPVPLRAEPQPKPPQHGIGVEGAWLQDGVIRQV